VLLTAGLVDARTLIAAQAEAAAHDVDVLLAPDLNGVLSSASPSLAHMLVSVVGLTDDLDAEQLLERLATPAERSTGSSSAEFTRQNLISIADRLAEAVGGHVLVEDSDFQLLGYSRLTEHTDAARREAILQRQLPGRYQQVFNSQGVLAGLLSGQDVIAAEAVPDAGLGRRLIVAIRRADQLLGSIWLARDEPAFTTEDIREMTHAAHEMSALLLDTLRAREDRRLREDGAARLLLAGKRPRETDLPDVARAALDTSAGHVIAMAMCSPTDEPPMSRLHAMRVLVEVTARSLRTPCVAVIDSDIVYAVHFGCTVTDGSCSGEAPSLLARHVSASLGEMGAEIAIGIGRHAEVGASLASSAASARDVLTMLRSSETDRIATAHQLWSALLVRDLLGELEVHSDVLPRAIVHLLSSRSARCAEDRRTMKVVLDHWGDVATIAAELHVHTNTVRYRLNRISSTYDVTLDDPTTRFALWALLRAIDSRQSSVRGGVA